MVISIWIVLLCEWYKHQGREKKTYKTGCVFMSSGSHWMFTPKLFIKFIGYQFTWVSMMVNKCFIKWITFFFSIKIQWGWWGATGDSFMFGKFWDKLNNKMKWNFSCILFLLFKSLTCYQIKIFFLRSGHLAHQFTRNQFFFISEMKTRHVSF